MILIMAFLIGSMYAGAIYMMMRRSIIKLVMGLIILANATNLLIFTVAGPLRRGAPPLIAEGSIVPDQLVADPLPQALILTAIVISFGVLAFAVVLIHRVYEVIGVDDMNNLKDDSE